MSEEKKETKEALLGELESIKALLSEAEWDDIPILNDAISVTHEAILDAEQAPAETAAHSEGMHPDKSGPGLELPSTTRETKLDTAAIRSSRSDIDAAIDRFHFNLDLDSEDEAEDEGTPPPEARNPAETSPVPAQPEVDELTTASAEAAAESRKEVTVNSEKVKLNAEIDAQDAPLDELPPGVLPGQRSLFEGAIEGTLQTPEQAPDQDTDQATGPGQTESAATSLSSPPQSDPLKPESQTDKVAAPAYTRRPAVKSRGENPFLPQHIRDRLHTHKALIDIIKETRTSPEPVSSAPSSTSASDKVTSPLELPEVRKLVDAIIADYLPRIETELRDKLTPIIQRHLADKSTSDPHD